MKHETIDRYTRSFPPGTRKILKELRAVIRKAAPGASEKMSYDMPAFFDNGSLVYFAAYKNHIGLYGAMSAFQEFESELASYRAGKGTLRFPLDRPIPLGLVRKIVEFRVKENSAHGLGDQRGMTLV